MSAVQSGRWTFALALLSMVIAVSYNARFKQTGLPGNALVSADVTLPFIYGGVVVGKASWMLLIFAALAFISSLGREIVKGIVDVAGDKVNGIASVAVKLGNEYAAKV